MPWKIKVIGRYGNAAVAVLFGLIVVGSLARGSLGIALLFLACAALAVFNWYVIEKCARATSEEEVLKGEVREAELRKELADYGRFASNTSEPSRLEASNRN
jgi:hypothetical protein